MQQYEKAVICFSWREIAAAIVGPTIECGRTECKNTNTAYKSDNGKGIAEGYNVDWICAILEHYGLDKFIPESKGRGQHDNIFTDLGGKLSGSKWLVLQDPHGSQQLQFSCR